MPELPDVVVYMERIAARVVGRELQSVRVASPFLLRTVAPPLAAVAYAQDPELAGAVVALRCRRYEVENLALDTA